MKKISILGSTGSIGTQALDVIAEIRDRFSVTATLLLRRAYELLCRADGGVFAGWLCAVGRDGCRGACDRVSEASGGFLRRRRD